MNLRFSASSLVTSAWLLIAFGGTTAALAEVQIEGCWVRVPPRGATITAGYCSIKNDTTLDVKITGVETPKVKTIELHETRTKNGSMEMVKLESFVVPPGETFVMQPGGHHLMLFDVNGDLRDGQELPLRFRFDTLPQKVAQAKVQAEAPVTSMKIDSETPSANKLDSEVEKP